jgi:hypothetical protein
LHAKALFLNTGIYRKSGDSLMGECTFTGAILLRGGAPPMLYTMFLTFGQVYAFHLREMERGSTGASRLFVSSIETAIPPFLNRQN